MMDSKNNLNRRRPWVKGFTLIEVAAAVFIFMMGIVGVISLFATATVLHKGARDKTMAALVIQQVISEIDSQLKTGALRDDSSNLKTVTEGKVRGYERYQYRVDFTEETMPGRSIVMAHVTVTWKEKGTIRGEEFDHIFRPGPDFSESVRDFRLILESTGPEEAEIEQ